MGTPVRERFLDHGEPPRGAPIHTLSNRGYQSPPSIPRRVGPLPFPAGLSRVTARRTAAEHLEIVGVIGCPPRPLTAAYGQPPAAQTAFRSTGSASRRAEGLRAGLSAIASGQAGGGANSPGNRMAPASPGWALGPAGADGDGQDRGGCCIVTGFGPASAFRLLRQLAVAGWVADGTGFAHGGG